VFWRVPWGLGIGQRKWKVDVQGPKVVKVQGRAAEAVHGEMETGRVSQRRKDSNGPVGDQGRDNGSRQMRSGSASLGKRGRQAGVGRH